MPNKLTKEEFVARSRAKHGNRYSYDKVVYVNNRTNVEIICPDHGEFWQTPTNHLKGCGCPACKSEKTRERCKKDTDWFIEKANKRHGVGTYNYSLVNYVNGHSKVKIICPKHGVFEQDPFSHLYGCGCPICKRSLGEESINLILRKYGIKYEREHRINNESLVCKNRYLFIDFFLPERNVFIEFQGEQHYRDTGFFKGEGRMEKQMQRDFAVRMYCRNHNIKLLEISYKQLKKIESVLVSKLGLNKVNIEE